MLTNAARAADCEPPSGVSPCIDANSLWIAHDNGRFASIPTAEVVERGAYVFGAASMYLSRPITLIAASPDPAGTEIPVVDDVVDVALLLGFGLGSRFELGITLPFSVFESGAGIGSITSSRAPPLPESAVRDPKLLVGYGLPHASFGSAGFDGKARLELTLPLGDEQAFAGERSVVLAPSLAMELELGSFYAGSEVGARIRPITEFGGARVGTQLELGLGAGLDLRSWLAVALEAWMLPVLVDQDRTLPDGTRVEDGLLVPAEWMVSARLMPSADLSFLAGFGGALPLSSERRVLSDGTSETDHFAGLTAPRWRALMLVRYSSGRSDAPAR
jgi:hypothetical protein